MKPKLQMKGVTQRVGSIIIEGDTWEYLIKRERPLYEITGKYLFFSTDRDQLVQLAIEELEHGGFHEAKIPLAGSNYGDEYVLCLYYKDDSRKHELAQKYRGWQGIKYRYWKSDEDTHRGTYSPQLRRQLSLDLQEPPSDPDAELSDEDVEALRDAQAAYEFEMLERLEPYLPVPSPKRKSRRSTNNP